MSPQTKAPSRLRAVVLGLALSLVAAAGSVVAAPPATAFDEPRIVALANDARAAEGRTALSPNAELDAVALAWAREMAAAGELSHNPAVGEQIPAGWSGWGENVASGYRDAQALHDGWMASARHRANILGDYTDLGVAFIDADGATWAVQVFVRYDEPVGAQPPGDPAAPDDPAESEGETPGDGQVGQPPAPVPSTPADRPSPDAPDAPTPVAEESAAAPTSPSPPASEPAPTPTPPAGSAGIPSSAPPTEGAADVESRPTDGDGTAHLGAVVSPTGRVDAEHLGSLRADGTSALTEPTVWAPWAAALGLTALSVAVMLVSRTRRR